MRKGIINIIIVMFVVVFGSVANAAETSFVVPFTPPDSLHYPVKDSADSPLYLSTPSNITTTVEYNPLTNEYVEVKKSEILSWKVDL